MLKQWWQKWEKSSSIQTSEVYSYCRGCIVAFVYPLMHARKVPYNNEYPATDLHFEANPYFILL